MENISILFTCLHSVYTSVYMATIIIINILNVVFLGCKQCKRENTHIYNGRIPYNYNITSLNHYTYTYRFVRTVYIYDINYYYY